MKTILLAAAFSFAINSGASGALWVDFNSTNQDNGPHNNAGWQPYSRGNEVDRDLGFGGNRTQHFQTSFAFTGDTTVIVTSDWTNSGLFARQSIDRAAEFDGSWTDTDLDLITDFLGIDTRINTGGNFSGGNGSWDGVTGTPTYMRLLFQGLPAGDYSWSSYHHDTEYAHGAFAVWLLTEGGAFTQLPDGMMTHGSADGNPGFRNTTTDFAGMAADGSIYTTRFYSNGVDPVTIRFAPYANADLHTQIWGINGFQLTQIPEPATGLLTIIGATLLLRRTRSGHPRGSCSR